MPPAILSVNTLDTLHQACSTQKGYLEESFNQNLGFEVPFNLE